MEQIGLNKIIKCHICDTKVSIRAISQHLNTHNIKFIDYVKQNRNDFPNWKECPICHINLTKGRTCSRECDKKFRHQQTGENSVRWGTHMSEGSKIKLGKSQKERLSKYGARNYLMGRNNSSCRIEVRNKISNTRIERKLAVGKNNPMFGKTHTVEAVKKIMSHRKMNKFEESVAKLLTENGYKYTFQFFISEDGVCKSYDFKIKGKPVIIEADGDFWHGNPDTKYHWKDSDAVIENDILKESMAKERGYNIIRVWESEFKKTPSILLEKLQNPIFI